MLDRFTHPTPERIATLLTNMSHHKIAVVGDVMLDAYIQGDVSRISPEAPVPVMKVQSQSCLLGGAGNVAKCLIALGAKVRLVGVIGDDADGQLVRDETEKLNMKPGDLLAVGDRPTIRKTRVVARHQQVIRLDQEDVKPLSTKAEQSLAKRATAVTKWADAIIISDYAKATVTDAVCKAIRKAADKKVILVDPKNPPWDRFAGCTHLKPNLLEASDWLQQPIKTSGDTTKAARQLAKQLNIPNIIITRGSDGMTLGQFNQQKQFKTQHLPATPLDVFDVTGAGDVVAAAMTLALASDASLADAAYLANIAAGIKLSRFGAASVSNQEILDTVRNRQWDCSTKVMTTDQAVDFAGRLRQQQKKIVFTNGCFDLLHFGHVRYLEDSRQLGDALVVGINADASVKRLKGSDRPVQSQDDRASILAALGCVDAVVIFNEDTPLELIKAIQPDVLTKGADYKRKQDIVGHDVVEATGGQVHRIPLVSGRSTSAIIKKQNG